MIQTEESLFQTIPLLSHFIISSTSFFIVNPNSLASMCSIGVLEYMNIFISTCAGCKGFNTNIFVNMECPRNTSSRAIFSTEKNNINSYSAGMLNPVCVLYLQNKIASLLNEFDTDAITAPKRKPE